MKEQLNLKDILFLVASCTPGCQGLWSYDHRSATAALMAVLFVQMFQGVNPYVSVISWKSFRLKSKQHLEKQLMFLSLS